MSKARIIDQSANIYPDMDPSAQIIGVIPVGEVIELGKIRRRKGKAWVSFTRTNGQSGYVSGDTHIFPIRQVETIDAVSLLDQPAADARVIHQYKKKERMTMLDVVRSGDSGWVKVKDPAGREGYINGKTRIRVVPDDLVAAGKKNLLVGALFTVGGLALTLATYLTSSNTGGSYIIAWGAVIFGVLQVVQGLTQYYNGRKDRESKK